MLRTLLLAALASPWVCACVSLDAPEENRAEDLRLEHSALGEMANVSVCGNIWLGSGASRSDLGIASRRGVETIVDLRSSTAGLDILTASAELGFEYLRARLEPEGFATSDLDRILVVLGRPDRGPVLLVCDDASRCAIVFAIHRVYNDHRSVEDALEEARRAGLKPGAGERAVLAQLERLKAYGARLDLATN